jgi:dipeptidase
MGIMRDGYQDTAFDLTDAAAFQVKGKKSPLARPWGPAELFDLLEVRPERAICTPTSGYVFIAQLRAWLPDAVGNCLWFAYGPANTSCFVPIHAGVTDLPDTWDHPANFTRIDREQPQWNFRLVHNLTNNLRYQDAMKDVVCVVQHAEERFLNMQADVDKAAVHLIEKRGARGAEEYLTDVARQCTTTVGYAYHDLVDYLMFRYLVGEKELARTELPRVAVPVISKSP